MHRFSLSILLSILFFAQTQLYAQDEKSTPIIQKLNAKLDKANTIKAEFTTLYNSAKGVTKSKISGKLTIKGDKYIIDMGSHRIYNNGKEVFTYLVDAKEVQISKYNPTSDPISPASLFSGDFTKGFNYKYIGEKTIGSRKVHQIELTPQKPNKSYVRLVFFIDEANYEISGGNVYEKNGNFYTIAISGLNMKANVPDNEFTLDTKMLKGVEVIYLK